MMGPFEATEEEAQDQLLAIAAYLEAFRLRLMGVRASLPVPATEPAMLVGEMEMDVSTEVRSVVECVVNDFINSAIRDLRSAADYSGDGKR
jgi:hypothetical protein